MSPARALLFTSVVALLTAGCGNGALGQSPTGTAKPAATARPTSQASVAIMVAVNLQNGYRLSDWKAVRRQFTDAQIASLLVNTMQGWRQARVRNLHVTPVYTRRLASGIYVETLKFYDDPRAVPYYAIYLVRPGNPPRILGTTSGINGTTFRDARWLATRSAHFVFYHSPYQLMGADRTNLADLEYQRVQFARKFGVKLPPVAAYYLYPTQALMERLTRDTSQACGMVPENIGCANPFATPPSIQASIWPTYHEPIHIYELSLEPKPPSSREVLVAPLFIAEGTAVALEDREVDPRLSDYCSDLSYAPLDFCGRIAAAHVKPLSLLSDDGFKASDPGYAYSLGGSFVKYLILRYGYHAFGRFYYVLAAQPTDRIADYNVASRAAYQSTIQRLLQQFISSLCAGGC